MRKYTEYGPKNYLEWKHRNGQPSPQIQSINDNFTLVKPMPTFFFFFYLFFHFQWILYNIVFFFLNFLLKSQGGGDTVSKSLVVLADWSSKEKSKYHWKVRLQKQRSEQNIFYLFDSIVTALSHDSYHAESSKLFFHMTVVHSPLPHLILFVYVRKLFTWTKETSQETNPSFVLIILEPKKSKLYICILFL